MPAIRVNSRITLVDIVVRSGGRPVTGLSKSNFHVTENGVPQTLVSVDEHNGDTPMPVEAPKLPPHTFTNYRAPGSGGSIVILLDALNTPQKDQIYVRKQLLSYLKDMPPDTSIAVFSLGSQLRMLQPFTTDSSALLAAINSPRSNPGNSPLLTDQSTSPEKASDVAQETEDEHQGPPGSDGGTDLAANLRQFEAEQDTFNYEFRVRLTMSALTQIADYLRPQPGRKDLIWISGSFPASILPNADLGTASFDATSNLSPLIQRTTKLLTDARLSVYPIDARGLMAPPVYDAGSRQSSRYLSPNSHPLQTADSQFGQQLASEHSAMSAVADQTGGRAFFNTNGIKEAIAAAAVEGTHYYTLAYVPTDREYDNTVRHVAVKVSPGSYQLNYRRTYIAGDPSLLATASAEPAGLDPLHAAFESGAPESSDILFDVSILPAKPEAGTTQVAAGKVLDWKGPVTKYAIDYAIDGRDLRPQMEANGKSHLDLEIVAIAYDDLGREVNAVSQSLTADLTAAQTANLQHGALPFHQEIDLPNKTVFLRVGVAEKSSGRTGSLEITMPSAKEH
jgi:VWFA-related protein